MDISQVVDIQTVTSPSALAGYDYQTILFLEEVTTTEYQSARWKIKRFQRNEIEREYEIGSRPRKIAELVYAQTPSVKEIVVAKWDVSNQSISDRLSEINTPWFVLVEVRAAHATRAAAWIESQRDKFFVFVDEDRKTADPGGICFQLKERNYKKTITYFHHDAGTLLLSCMIRVQNGIATVSADSTAKVVVVRIAEEVNEGDTFHLSYQGTDARYVAEESPTATIVRDGFKEAIEAETRITDSLRVDLSGDDGIQFTAKNPGTDFHLNLTGSLSQSVTVENSTAFHHRAKGDWVRIANCSLEGCEGYFPIQTVPDVDQFTFRVNARDGTSENVTADCGFGAVGAAVASNRFAWELGEVDFHYFDLNAVRATPPEILTTDLVSKLTKVHANTFQEMRLSSAVSSGRRMTWGGRVASGNFANNVLVGLIWYPLEMQKVLASYITGVSKTAMTDVFLGGMWLVMQQFSEQARQKNLTGEFQKNLELYPSTGGFPPSFQPGDHYINIVPLVASLSTEDRKKWKVSGVEYHFQTSGGVEGITIKGTMVE